MVDQANHKERESLTFQWTLHDVKNVFESSQGDAKSKVMRSPMFGDGKWQVLFYANAGIEGGFVSLYLSCEPTWEEMEKALDGKWIRDGTYKFILEIGSEAYAICSKDASGHVFTHKSANWGWAQFSRRDAVYHGAPTSIRRSNILTITCNIESTVLRSDRLSGYRRQQVPKSLTETVGSLLDDPLYSDVEFIFPRRGSSSKKVKKILAAKALLKRIYYFDSMFYGGFAEGLPKDVEVNDHGDTASDKTSVLSSCVDYFEDSDAEDDALEFQDSEEGAIPDEPLSGSTYSKTSTSSSASISDNLSISALAEDGTGAEDGASDSASLPQGVDQTAPKPNPLKLTREPREPESQHIPSGRSHGAQSHKIFTVRIEDAAYTTYRAVLYYIYTDTIFFAPLSSSFISEAEARTDEDVQTSAPSQNPSDNQGGSGHTTRSSAQTYSTYSSCVAARREWIKQWTRTHPGLPTPCSAKAVYRLADKLDLLDLKQRAEKHIINALTVVNIAYEVFSPFSASFEDMRKIAVDFFLNHWVEIRTSDAMRNLWQQIRTGRHPGFEEVWPVIAQHLEFKPRVQAAGSGES